MAIGRFRLDPSRTGCPWSAGAFGSTSFPLKWLSSKLSGRASTAETSATGRELARLCRRRRAGETRDHRNCLKRFGSLGGSQRHGGEPVSLAAGRTAQEAIEPKRSQDESRSGESQDGPDRRHVHVVTKRDEGSRGEDESEVQNQGSPDADSPGDKGDGHKGRGDRREAEQRIGSRRRSGGMRSQPLDPPLVE